MKDDWQLKPGVTVSLGLCYDWQNYFHDANNFAPRMSIAYAPGGSKTNVIRAGAGVFNDRSGPVVIADVLHSQPGGLVRYVITDPSYPDPFQGGVGAAEPPSIVQLAPDVQIPQLFQYSVGVDHQLSKATMLSVTTPAREARINFDRVTSTRRRRRATRRGRILLTASSGRSNQTGGWRAIPSRSLSAAVWRGDSRVKRSTPGAVRATTRTASRGFRPMTTICPVNGAAPTRIGRTGSCCSDASARGSLPT